MNTNELKKLCDEARVFDYHCRMCDEDKQVTVRIEHEYGDFGSVLSSWPEFDVEPKCLGFHDPQEGGVDLVKRVTSEMIAADELTETEIERAQERCSFYYEEPWENPDGAWVLGMNQERGRLCKRLSAILNGAD